MHLPSDAGQDIRVTRGKLVGEDFLYSPPPPENLEGASSGGDEIGEKTVVVGSLQPELQLELGILDLYSAPPPLEK